MGNQDELDPSVDGDDSLLDDWDNSNDTDDVELDEDDESGDMDGTWRNWQTF